jgi:pantoate--beta-alanine ligase
LCHVEPAAFALIHEGKARPEFFRGVATVVCKLFNIVQPTRAYFGQKDVSQCILIQNMIKDLNMPVKVRVCETVRESDGLAMSSRNVYLTAIERNKADILYKALQAGSDACKINFSKVETLVSRESIIAAITQVLKSEPLVTNVEYVSAASPLNMKEMEYYNPSEGMVLSSAIRVGSVRLIDNLLVGAAKNVLLDA